MTTTPDDDRRIMETFQASLLTEEVSALPFEEFVAHLRTPAVLEASTAFMKLLVLRSDGGIHPVDGTAQVNVRVILAGYMIKLHPNHVFEAMGLSEQILLNASRDMDESFRNVVIGAGTWDACKHAVEVYVPIFRAWKTFDHAAVIERMERAILMIRAACDAAIPEERLAMELQIVRLSNRRDHLLNAQPAPAAE
jgi:hypothetical protein